MDDKRPPESGGEVKTIESIEYCEGYRKALMDLHVSLSKWGPAFRADRKRNNVKNVVWLLECLLNNPDTFAAYGPETPIYFREAGKRLNYYIREEWPVSQCLSGSSERPTR